MTADFLTIDFYAHTVPGTRPWRRVAKTAVAAGLDGLRAASVNPANTGTFTLVPRPVGSCLVLAWSSPGAACAAWRGPLRNALGGPGHYSLDGEVARTRVEEAAHDWYGRPPSAVRALR